MTDESKFETQQRFAVNPELVPRLRQGQLIVFFGMAPGVGKTYAMMQAAREEKLAGRDVVIGYLDSHGAKAINDFAKGINQVPVRHIQRSHLAHAQTDLDAVLATQPDVVILDDLAHTTVPDSRHFKGGQNVRKLLEAGIDIYTTLNLQDIASQAKAVQELTGLPIGQVVPDSLLENATVKLIDLSPVKLRERISHGLAYLTQDAELTSHDFFSEKNLWLLRELAWRWVTERISDEAQNYPQKLQLPSEQKTAQLLLAAISANAASEQVVRWTRSLADALNCPWIAVYVETPYPPGEVEHAQIARNLAVAGELGAEVITTTGTDLVAGLLRVARQRNATQIVIGKPPSPTWRIFQRDRVVRRLMQESGMINVHAVCERDETQVPSFHRWHKLNESTWTQYLIAIGVVAVVTAIALLLGSRVGPPHSSALIFLLGVVVLGSFVGRGPTLVAALMSALLWDYFILPPVFAFRITHFEDALVFGMYFVVALFMGQLTTRIRAQQEIERLGEERATALYLLTRELTEATNLDQIVQRAVQQMERVFHAQVAVLLSEPPDQGDPPLHPTSTFKPTEDGRRAATWALEHGQQAGKFTANEPLADALYAPLATSQGTVGVIGLRFNQSFPLTVHQLNLLGAFLEQMVLALDRKRLNEISERAKVLAESERLTKTLLDSMSHEVRTPIAAIMSATSMLAELQMVNSQPLQKEMVEEIQEATGRLNRLVGNFLEVSHLESGAVKPNLSDCEVSDLVYTVLEEMEKELSRHKVNVIVTPDLPLVVMDFVLMQHALTNLLSNAILHTPAGTLIEVNARIEGDSLSIVVADAGPGIPPASMNQIFDKFYRAPNAPNGGTGLGLSLVKGFMEAQGGMVQAENRLEGGAKFILLLPLGRKIVSSGITL